MSTQRKILVNEDQVKDWVTMYLEDDNSSFRDLLELFDLTPEETFWRLFEAGLIDQDLMERLL